MSAHDAVTCILAYLAIGSIVWLAFYHMGAVHQAYANRRNPQVAILIASLAVIVLWPVPLWVFVSSYIRERCR